MKQNTIIDFKRVRSRNSFYFLSNFEWSSVDVLAVALRANVPEKLYVSSRVCKAGSRYRGALGMGGVRGPSSPGRFVSILLSVPLPLHLTDSAPMSLTVSVPLSLSKCRAPPWGPGHVPILPILDPA